MSFSGENQMPPALDGLIDLFFCVFHQNDSEIPDLACLPDLFVSQALIIKNSDDGPEIYSPDSFLNSRNAIFASGTLRAFREWETSHTTKIHLGIAHRTSFYQKEGYLKGRFFRQNGVKFFHFVATAQGWKIASLMWQDDPPQWQDSEITQA